MPGLKRQKKKIIPYLATCVNITTQTYSITQFCVLIAHGIICGRFASSEFKKYKRNVVLQPSELDFTELDFPPPFGMAHAEIKNKNGYEKLDRAYEASDVAFRTHLKSESCELQPI